VFCRGGGADVYMMEQRWSLCLARHDTFRSKFGIHGEVRKTSHVLRERERVVGTDLTGREY